MLLDVRTGLGECQRKPREAILPCEPLQGRTLFRVVGYVLSGAAQQKLHGVLEREHLQDQCMRL